MRRAQRIALGGLLWAGAAVGLAAAARAHSQDLAGPAGRISRYLFGIEYPPRDLRLALVESAGGRIGSPVDQLLLYCFHYDPATGSYSAVALNVLRLAAAATVVALALLVALLLRRERLRVAQGTA